MPGISPQSNLKPKSSHCAIILDDDPDVRGLLRDWLSVLGFQKVIDFEWPGEFLKVLPTLEPELIVTDLGMPDIDGLDVLNRLAAQEIKCPVVILSELARDIIDIARYIGLTQGLNVLGALSKSAPFEQFAELISQRGKARPVTPINTDDVSFVYQPCFATDTMAVARVEALVRIGGESPSVDDLYTIEVSEQANELWELTLNTTLSDWRKLGIPEIGLAINVDENLVIRPNFHEQLVRALGEHEVPPSSVTLELTERTTANDRAASVRALSKLRLLGINIALDDYGSFHATIGRVRRLPVSELKLDRSLIQKGMDGDYELLLQATRLSRALGIPITAEGIESQAQLDFAKEIGADYFQGFLLATPQPIAHLKATLA